MQFAKGKLIQPGTVAIECGAHHGSESILLSRWVGDAGKVIVIEPMPDNIAILDKNIELNDLKSVTLIEKAASSFANTLA
jgi:FkbM family methyltransferase